MRSKPARFADWTIARNLDTRQLTVRRDAKPGRYTLSMKLEILESVPSTMDVARGNVRSGAVVFDAQGIPSCSGVMALEQTAGRGQRGRTGCERGRWPGWRGSVRGSGVRRHPAVIGGA